METLGLELFGDAYRDRRVLLTGHTGFKGSWLALWLHAMQAEVVGLALDPDTEPNHWDLLELDIGDLRLDIRDSAAVSAAMARFDPEIVFHLAAQPLVPRSYREPLETWSTNVMGTAHVLDAARACSVDAIVIVTTDKVYEDSAPPDGYREGAPLGGHDPYSASKAACEIVTDSYRRSFFSAPDAPLVASARAGNVIGGGDWSENRLIPDIIRAVSLGAPLEIRRPEATRPWQHVLECLSGYLMLGESLLRREADRATAWNFGPDRADSRRVIEVLEGLQAIWPAFDWQVRPAEPALHEAESLILDTSMARSELGWRPVWRLPDALDATAGWYRDYFERGQVTSRAQLDAYVTAAHRGGRSWVRPCR